MRRNLYIFEATSPYDRNAPVHYYGVYAVTLDSAYWWLYTHAPSKLPELTVVHTDTYCIAMRDNGTICADVADSLTQYPACIFLTVPAGVRVRILKGEHSAANGGVSDYHAYAVLCGNGPRNEPITEVTEAGPDCPPLVLGMAGGRVHAKPMTIPGDKLGPMFGGNFIYSSDSRFPFDHPIHLHDRFETQEQYDALSQ